MSGTHSPHHGRQRKKDREFRDRDFGLKPTKAAAAQQPLVAPTDRGRKTTSPNASSVRKVEVGPPNTDKSSLGRSSSDAVPLNRVDSKESLNGNASKASLGSDKPVVGAGNGNNSNSNERFYYITTNLIVSSPIKGLLIPFRGPTLCSPPAFKHLHYFQVAAFLFIHFHSFILTFFVSNQHRVNPWWCR